ncbi:hypothetical protein JKF63_06142 [Porcisia hertigi]|uniref:SKI-interacting protein SKIP SNW domain-containing protein n=1 Tax=Porcisia hertigi TaxID=2761500 RepID=A0A836ITS2_9TRYP|nr:hypothetical protein JKF63_06142 [Porcisia hertigi]
MSLQFYDGGSFADCHFIQYPHGMGKQRAPAMVLAAVAALSSESTNTKAPLETTAHRHPSLAGAARATHSGKGGPLAPAYSPSSPSASNALTVVPQTSLAPSCAISATTAPDVFFTAGETAEETTTRTALVLQETLTAARQKTEVFDSHSLAVQRRLRSASNKPNGQALALTITAAGGGSASLDGTSRDPGPIVRSPTKEKKSHFTDALLLRSGGGGGGGKNTKDEADDGGNTLNHLAPSTSSSMMLAAVSEHRAGGGGGGPASSNPRKVVVPFCVSSWQNRKKLIVPVEQRLAQQQDDRLDPSGGISDAVMDLAVAMQKASKEVAVELAEKERAKAAEEERRQAALEAAEAEKARQLLEQKAAELAAHAQRRETREQRMERIRLERELREQEKLAKQQQRLRERAATRLNITVEDLEADEQLLRSVEEASVYAGGGGSGGAALSADPTAPPSSREKPERHRGVGGQAVGDDGDDDGDGVVGGRRKPAVRGGVFASAVISNEGIQREMQALAEVEGQQPQQQHDGIRLREDEDDDEDDDDGGGFQFNKLAKKKQRL